MVSMFGQYDRLQAEWTAFCIDEGRCCALVPMNDSAYPNLFCRSDELRPAASVLKIPVAATLYREARMGVLRLDENVTRATLGRTRYPTLFDVFDVGRQFSLRETCALS